MHTTPSLHTIVLGLALVLTLGAGLPQSAQPGRNADAPDGRAAVARPIPPLTSGERDTVAWATSRFSLVGLALPEVDIWFHDDTQPCGGADGVYRNGRERPRVLVCVPDRGTYASTLERRRTLVHELAHAWEQASLDDDDRAELLPIVDADDWYAPDAAWADRGAERLAETIVWGLYDQLRRPTLIDVPCRELHADFVAITGTTAPGPLASNCELDATSDHTNTNKNNNNEGRQR